MQKGSFLLYFNLSIEPTQTDLKINVIYIPCPTLADSDCETVL